MNTQHKAPAMEHSIHGNYQAMKTLAVHHAKEHNCNYNVIIMNSNNGVFDPSKGSTYEYVRDSYFEKERPDVVLLHRTDDLIKGYPRVLGDPNEPCIVYVRDEATAFMFNWNPLRKSRPGEENWPLDTLDRIDGIVEVTKLVKDLLFPVDDDETPFEDEKDHEGYEGIINKHGDNYDWQKDYERVFAK